MGKTFTPEEIEEFQRKFKELDVEGTNHLTRTVAAQIIGQEGSQLEQLMIVLLFELYDKNGDNFIDFDEFLQFCEEMDNLSEKGILRRIFQLADKSGNGYLDVMEVERLGHLMGLDVTTPDAWATIQALDTNQDNQIDIHEFFQILNI